MQRSYQDLGGLGEARDLLPIAAMEAFQQEWEVAEAEFRPRAPAAEQLAFLLRYAVLAPSTHNSQPWLFRVDGDSVRLYADRTRALPLVDPDDRGLIISCGAALQNLRLAIRRVGRADHVEILPAKDDPDLLAVARMGAAIETDAVDDRLFEAIVHRHTNRSRFEMRELPESVVWELIELARQEGASLVVAVGPQPHRLAELISRADRLQAADPRFRRELAAWVHPNRTHSRDGMPGAAFGLSNLASDVGPLVVRTFDWGRGKAAIDHELAEGSALLAVLCTAADSPADWMAAGQALERVLLSATSHGVAASFLNQPLELPELRPGVARALEIDQVPQLVLRFGYAPDEASATPRRPVESVLLG